MQFQQHSAWCYWRCSIGSRYAKSWPPWNSCFDPLFSTSVSRSLFCSKQRSAKPLFISVIDSDFHPGDYPDKIGALIVIERGVGLKNLIDAGVQLDARLSYDLLVTIFHPTTPLHDGAVVIQDEKVAAASVFLPLTKNPSVSRDLGTRHRAAIGVTEGSDAISIVVSEETGSVSFVERGEMRRNLDSSQLKNLLLNAMDIRIQSSNQDRSIEKMTVSVEPDSRRAE